MWNPDDLSNIEGVYFHRGVAPSVSTLYENADKKLIILEAPLAIKGYADTFPADKPLLIISSKHDTRASHDNSIQLAAEIASKRITFHPNHHPDEAAAPVYFLQLDEPDHNQYASQHFRADAERYRHFTHKILGVHGLNNETKYANSTNNIESIKIADFTQGALKDQMAFLVEFEANESCRLEIRKKAFNHLCESLKELRGFEKKRAIEICLSMPLYHQHLGSRWKAFGKTAAQVALENLLKPKRARRVVKSKLASLVDDINRQGFEALFDGKGDSRVIPYAVKFLARVISLPVTATIYVASRMVGVVFNPAAMAHNKVKTLSMRLVTGFTTAIVAASIYPLVNSSFISDLSGILGVANSVCGLLLCVTGVIALSMGLLGAKKMSQSINAESIPGTSDVFVTAPKHQMLISTDHTLPLHPYMTAHQEALRAHYQERTASTNMVLAQFEALTQKHFQGEFISDLPVGKEVARLDRSGHLVPNP